MGFIDKNGKTVIPFKYVATYGNPHFDKDSLMEVSFDSVQGKLHRMEFLHPINRIGGFRKAKQSMKCKYSN